ncbi:helix-turn-helix transcriptional regulator [Agrobacterium vitis]|uniref:helix-turn-helix transcriptional regulator n=1 Tax=Agrobacterium vitis TaxID=373 RepID=UPI0009BE4F2E|nr:helix-turn-helix domain-containing protein [Agrobacterium vitis]MCM2471093.1 helix-turn-helix transcriptional regulator [Agrobacterium vitis]MUO70086.1 helix-turn-helix domain-containing protein [Agrobacterium vitis]
MLKDNFKQLRVNAGLSQSQLAKLAGKSQQLVSQIEAGELTNPPSLIDFARALNCDVADLDERFRKAPIAGQFEGDRLAEIRKMLDTVSRETLALSRALGGNSANQTKTIPIVRFDEINSPFPLAGNGAITLDIDHPSATHVAAVMRTDRLDRVAPPGSTIVLESAPAMLDGMFYLVEDQGKRIIGRYRENPDRIQPFSNNPSEDIEILSSSAMVIGRIVKAVISL